MEAAEGASEEVEVVGWVESGLVEVSVDICWKYEWGFEVEVEVDFFGCVCLSYSKLDKFLR